MNKKDKEILRVFRASMIKPEEKAAFDAILTSSRDKRLGYILAMNALGITKEQQDAILAATALTKEDRMFIAGQAARGFILKLFSFLSGGGWK
jgi:hypothetical protein